MIKLHHGDCRQVLATLPAESVQCVVTSPRNKGQFKPGVHAYRQPLPHWERDWLVREYVERQRSCGEIAAEIGCTDANVLFWLRKHRIERRSVSEARALKHWGASGAANPMHGRTGAANPRYVDGSSPERQRTYSRFEGRQFLQAVRCRDDFRCQRCMVRNPGGPRDLHVHHLKPWAGNPALRFAMDNVITLCRKCHNWVHSRANADREYLL